MILEQDETGEAREPVTVVGLGSMGTALAEAFIAAGHPTTVWNRSPEKAVTLVAKGARHVDAIGDALAASPIIVACLSTYDATREALGPAGAALSRRTLVTLNSGTPASARKMTAWATARGARYLDGAVKDVPSAVGLPGTVLYYSGDQAVFDEHLTTLEVLGGNTIHLGAEPDLAALYETAVGGTLLPALLGFFQGAALVTSRGLPASTLVPYTVEWLKMIGSVLPTLAEEIDSGDYSRAASSISTFHEQIADEQALGEQESIDTAWQLPMHDLIRRAVSEGRGEQSIAALTELLRKP